MNPNFNRDSLCHRVYGYGRNRLITIQAFQLACDMVFYNPERMLAANLIQSIRIASRLSNVVPVLPYGIINPCYGLWI